MSSKFSSLKRHNKKRRKLSLVFAILIFLVMGPSTILISMGMRIPKPYVWGLALIFTTFIALCIWGIRNINREP